MALLAFSALTALAIVSWLHRGPAVWTWKGVLAAGCAVLAVTTSALVWRLPSRTHAVIGIAIMLASLARVGAPSEWTWVSFALVAVTFVLLMPLVHAAIVLRDDE
ncbi:hypothetical protein AKJ09_07559 [Labilithrix luteola]|uniref:Integral membrane protein n=2 Tax=Labilithrix luteola TaxID=1391654 RepID=A0A0K1Q4Y4_9BACT|nr:hypothetical protein AKJ09_07559 [Labilithrix luteola]